MFLLTDKLPDSLIFKDRQYQINLSFDNVLRFFDLLEDDEFEDLVKIEISLEMFVYRFDLMEFDSPLEMVELYKYILLTFLDIDLNEMMKEDTNDNSSDFESSTVDKKTYDYKKDAKLIFASFLRYYRIDLFEEMGKLDYRKFNALLSELDDESPFKKAVKYRTIKIPKMNDSNKEYVQSLKKLKEYYSLEDSTSVPEEKAIENVNKGFDEVAKVFMKTAKK